VTDPQAAAARSGNTRGKGGSPGETPEQIARRGDRRALEHPVIADAIATAVRDW
jgi:hypothetical protein